ncbi:unnamed protein product [Thelazia callipaeda]|uniref:Ovule protein n=1 Tax=Thelazia callipaeda TaxID=103827 RepID=A0A0N5CVV4_THECL|nr:unnamed protein product [Thelazia callipaeda]
MKERQENIKGDGVRKMEVKKNKADNAHVYFTQSKSESSAGERRVCKYRQEVQVMGSSVKITKQVPL